MGQTLQKAPEETRRDLSALRINRDEVEQSNRPAIRYAIVTLIVLLALAGIGAVSYRVLTSTAAVPEVSVGTAIVDSGDTSYELLTATGSVVAHTKAAVGPKISGRLEYIGVDVGSLVKRDQILGRLEHVDLDSQLADAKATLANAQAAESQAQAAQALANATLSQANATEHQTNLDFGRQTQLLKDGVASRSDFDNADAKEKVSVAQVRQAQAQINSANAQLNSARSQIQSAQAKIRSMETQLEYCNIRAPFDGIVISKDADLGEMVAPAIFGGSFTRGSVVTIVDPKTLEVEADVNESNIIKIESGLPAEITLDAIPNKKFKAEAYQIVPTADRQKATVKVKVRFLEIDPRVLPDMS
ncbi:MAG: efflux RND transporter periplasmic adaptor subunit, partial [Blastocatellia bacterium]